jgi:NTP pyrophosphatase (non-canonical NTP hydrolase)
MDIDDLIDKLSKINTELNRQFPMDQDKLTLARVVKLTEELGELANEVLNHLKLQRPEKLAQYKTENLEKEFADVMGSLFLLAINLNLDVKKIMARRLVEINQRLGLD